MTAPSQLSTDREAMREKVAKAMWERGHDEPWSEAHYSPEARQIYWDDADAAVEAVLGAAQACPDCGGDGHIQTHADGRSIECPNCHNANKYGDYEGPTCEVCMGDGVVAAQAGPDLRAAAERVCWFDWSDNDMDAVAAVEALRKVIAAPQPASNAYSVPDGFVLVPKQALDWLDGAGQDADGKWFGETEPLSSSTRAKPYWWRSKFRSMIPALSSTDRCTCHPYIASQYGHDKSCPLTSSDRSTP